MWFIGGRNIMNNVCKKKERNIMNNILALHEILHETKRRGAKGVVLKLDFEKAYDRVHWGF
jgi:hypothetical protein